MNILGIESSCDETGVAIYNDKQKLVAHALYSQVALHQKHGGVVPEIASRDHIKQIVLLINDALQQATLQKTSLHAIAYTAGPGLIGALLTGASFAKSLAFSLSIPALAVHHLEAHLLAAQLDNPTIDFPFLTLLVSGGHTQLVYARSLGNYELLGDTLDDAAGEAFDKTAKLMGIPYPGGPKLAQVADLAALEPDLHFPIFPRPMTDKPGLDFSFSGLKTCALLAWQKSGQTSQDCKLIAFAFQQAVVETLLIKCQRALEKTQASRLVVAGGVGANQALRLALIQMLSRQQVEVFFPRPAYCTDNGAMVAYAGFLHFANGRQDKSLAIDVKARWPLPNQ